MGRDMTSSSAWLERVGLGGILASGAGPNNRFPLYPSTWCCWYRPRVVNQVHSILWSGDDGQGAKFCSLDFKGTVSNDPWQCRIRGDGGTDDALSANEGASKVADRWYHGLGTFNHSTLRACYSNGRHRGTNTQPNDPGSGVTHNTFAIGMARDSSPGTPANGVIAEVGIWKGILGDLAAQQLGPWRYAPPTPRST